MSRRTWVRIPLLSFMVVAGLATPVLGQPPVEDRAADGDPLAVRIARRCTRGSDAVFDPDPTASPARERLEAIKEYERCLAGFEIQAMAGDSRVASGDLAELRTQQLQVRDSKAAAQAESDFMGISFGVGVGVSFSEDDVISNAEIGASGAIVATEDDTEIPRVILESHYYGFCKRKKCKAGRFGIGPYFGIVAKSDKLISAFSAGMMFGWKDPEKADRKGFSVGIGAILDDDVKSLADGFEEGKPLPPGETQIRFETRSRWSGIVFFTRTF